MADTSGCITTANGGFRCFSRSILNFVLFFFSAAFDNPHFCLGWAIPRVGRRALNLSMALAQ